MKSSEILPISNVGTSDKFLNPFSSICRLWCLYYLYIYHEKEIIMLCKREMDKDTFVNKVLYLQICGMVIILKSQCEVTVCIEESWDNFAKCSSANMKKVSSNE